MLRQKESGGSTAGDWLNPSFVSVSADAKMRGNQQEFPHHQDSSGSNPLGDWLTKTFGGMNQPWFLSDPSPPVGGHAERARFSDPTNISPRYGGDHSRPYTLPSKEPDDRPVSREAAVQKGIDRLRAQTSHASMALDSVVEDILKRRTQRLGTADLAPRDRDIFRPESLPVYSQPASKPPSAYSSLGLGRSAYTGLQFLPEENTNSRDTSKSVSYSSQGRDTSKSVPYSSQSMLSVGSHPLFYRSFGEAPHVAPVPDPVIDEFSTLDVKHELEQKLRSMEDAIRGLDKQPTTESTPPIQQTPPARVPEIQQRQLERAKSPSITPSGGLVSASSKKSPAQSTPVKFQGSQVKNNAAIASPFSPLSPSSPLPGQQTASFPATSTVVEERVPFSDFLMVESIEAKISLELDQFAEFGDLFCNLEVGTNAVQTKAVKPKANPSWSEGVTVSLAGVDQLSTVLRVSVCCGKDPAHCIVIGKAQIALRDVLGSLNGQPKWHPLVSPDEGSMELGSLCLRVSSRRKDGVPPPGAAGRLLPVSEGSRAAAEPLPEGWTEHWSKTKNKPFYSNKLTGVTCWQRPAAP